MTATDHAPPPTRTTFARFVDLVQFLALVAGCTTIVLLFAVGKEAGPTDAATSGPAGGAIYAERCAGCHGDGRQGGTGPALVGVGERYSPSELVAIVESGRNNMPPFGTSLGTAELLAVAAFVAGEG